MENLKKDMGLILAIVFASAAVSGSLVFFAMQQTASGDDLKVSIVDAQIDEAIERYVEKKQKEAEEQQAAAAAEQAKKSAEMAVNVDPVTEKDHVYGDKDAKITLVEYSDFQCPYCRKFHGTAKTVVDKYSGEVNWVYRHYPLAFHEPVATMQAVASECAAEIGGNDVFWQFADKLFENNPSNKDSLIAAAGEVGVDAAAFTECMESGRYDELVAYQMQDGTESGVQGTPGTIVLNNATGEAYLMEGAQPSAAFDAVIEGML